jgi:hypothetical protein
MSCANAIHLLLCTFAVTFVAGQYFDMSEGDAGMITPCPTGDYKGVWTEEDASLYPDPPEGPLDGKVLTSQFKTKSCIRTPELFEVDEDYLFQMYVYLPETNVNRKMMLVWLVRENDDSEPIIQLNGPTEAKWQLIQVEVPRALDVTYPDVFKVQYCSIDIDCILGILVWC